MNSPFYKNLDKCGIKHTEGWSAPTNIDTTLCDGHHTVGWTPHTKMVTIHQKGWSAQTIRWSEQSIMVSINNDKHHAQKRMVTNSRMATIHYI